MSAPFFGPGVGDDRKALSARAILFEKVLAQHDTAEPTQPNYGLRCKCGLHLFTTDERVVLEMHRTHVAVEMAKATLT